MRIQLAMIVVCWLASPLARAEADLQRQYISDDVTVSLRDQPNTDAGTQGTVHSGDRVQVLQSEGAGSFARVRTADGREGWIPARYLTGTAAAREQLEAVQQQLDNSHTQVQSLKSQVEAAQQQLAQLKPAADLEAQNEQLRAKLDSADKQLADFRSRDQAEFERRQTLLYGGGLLGAGLLVGLLLPWLMRPRRRRYSDF